MASATGSVGGKTEIRPRHRIGDDVMINEILANVKNLHANIASDVWPNGATLYCHSCGSSESITPEQCGQFLALGWPFCCDKTMKQTPPQD